MSFDKRLMHYKTFEAIEDMLYKNVFHKHNVSSDEIIIKEDGTPLQGYTIKCQESKRTYFIMSDDMKLLPIKVTESEEVIYSNKVYHKITDSISLKSVSNKGMSGRDLIDTLFPLKSNEELDLLVGKLLMMTCTISRSFCRLITKQGYGKDGVFNSIMTLSGMGFNITNLSPAKAAQCLDQGYGMFNEIAGLKPEMVVFTQNLFLHTGDVSNTKYEHETTGSNKSKSKYNISKFGYIIAHNIPEYYQAKGKDVFEEMYTQAVVYRIMPFELEGQIIDNEFKALSFDAKQVLRDNLDDLQKWINTWTWYRDNFSSLKLTYDISKYNLKAQEGEEVSRWFDSWMNLAIFVEDYSENETEFYKIMDHAYKRHKQYVDKMLELGLLV